MLFGWCTQAQQLNSDMPAGGIRQGATGALRLAPDGIRNGDVLLLTDGAFSAAEGQFRGAHTATDPSMFRRQANISPINAHRAELTEGGIRILTITISAAQAPLTTLNSLMRKQSHGMRGHRRPT